MDELKNIVASNLIELRVASGMTQSQLAEKINYSDKSVSKWERAEAIPDVAVLKNIAEVFGVTVDYLITTHDRWERKTDRQPSNDYRRVGDGNLGGSVCRVCDFVADGTGGVADFFGRSACVADHTFGASFSVRTWKI